MEDKIASAALAYFGEVGLDATFDPVRDVVKVNDIELALTGVRATAFEDRRPVAQLVAERFDHLLSLEYHAGIEWAEAYPRLRTVLVGDDEERQLVAKGMYPPRNVAPGLYEKLVLRLDGTGAMRQVNHDDVNRWGQRPFDLIVSGRLNNATEEVVTVERESRPGLAVHQGPGCTGATIFTMDPGPYGILFSVPHKGLLATIQVTGEAALEAVTDLLHLTGLAYYDRTTTPVSLGLYWLAQDRATVYRIAYPDGASWRYQRNQAWSATLWQLERDTKG